MTLHRLRDQSERVHVLAPAHLRMLAEGVDLNLSGYDWQ